MLLNNIYLYAKSIISSLLYLDTGFNIWFIQQKNTVSLGTHYYKIKVNNKVYFYHNGNKVIQVQIFNDTH